MPGINIEFPRIPVTKTGVADRVRKKTVQEHLQFGCCNAPEQWITSMICKASRCREIARVSYSSEFRRGKA